MSGLMRQEAEEKGLSGRSGKQGKRSGCRFPGGARATLLKCGAWVFWIGVWALLAAVSDNDIFLASPLQTGRRLLSLLGQKEFYVIIGCSLMRIGAGFTAGLLGAAALAAASRRLPFLEELLWPVMELMKTVPIASFAVLLLIWWGSSGLAAAVSLVVVLPNVYISLLEGLKSMDIQLLEMAAVFRLSFGKRFFYIYRPMLRPFLQSSLKGSLGMCWKAGVAAEVIGIPARSIGEQLYLSKLYLDTAGVFAWTVATVAASVLLEKLILRLWGLFSCWEPACRGSDKRKGTAGSGADACLRIGNLTKSYEGRTVLSDLSAVYEPGMIYFLAGPSGSGKTTLLRILAGLTMPDSGVCRTPGACSMVFQEDRLCEEYSAVRNVELVTGDRGKAQRALLRLLQEDELHKPCSRLSGGMRRRVALVRAMEADSAYVLLDEPFTGMDDRTRMLAEAYIREMQQGRILIIASHQGALSGSVLKELS